MKRLAAILLSGSLVCALSFLVGTGAVANNTAGSPTANDSPTVAGELLNPAYFAHAAYVMQGTSDRAKVFALPLNGVPELAFLPTATGIDPASVTWSLDVSHPEGIGAEIAGGTLFIWGNSSTWSGYGSVTLTGTAGGATASVTIPVTVFRSDKTMIHSDGKKRYFVPWSPQLDINRILSTEEHMRQYSKPDIGLLDHTLRFSSWRLMEVRKDVDVATMWLNALTTDGAWPLESQLALVDVYLAELQKLGVNGIRTQNEYYISSEHGTVIAPLYRNRNSAGPTKLPAEEAYVISEAHRLGMSVVAGNMVSVGDGIKWAELFWASPQPLSEFLANFRELSSVSLANWTRLGVDIVDLCPAVSSLNQYAGTAGQATELSDGIAQLVENARALYPGPLFHSACFGVSFFPGKSILEAPFWRSFDVIGFSDWNIRLTSLPDPTVEQLADGWRALISQYFRPFQQRFDKPFLMTDNGCIAAKGCANYGLFCDRTASFDASRPSMEDVAKYIRSEVLAFEDVDGFSGPGWYAYPLSPYHRGGVRDSRDYALWLKVDDVIQEMFLGETRPRVIAIDGRLGDWKPEFVVVTDPVGDSRGSADITRISFAQDDAYFYFRIDYAAPPSSPGMLSIAFDVDGDRQLDLQLLLNNIWTSWAATGNWVGADLYGVGSAQSTKLGAADSVDSGNSIEARIARRYFRDYITDAPVGVRITHFTQDWKMEDEASWFAFTP